MNCVINSAWGDGYVKGQNRMIESIRSQGYKGDILTWRNEKINYHHITEHPYTMKAAAFWEALKKGYKNILWLDCSVMASKDITPIFDVIEKEGVYFWRSGWLLSDSATDRDLEIAGMDRDQAEKLMECASGIVGINTHNPMSRHLLLDFIDMNAAGVCSTSRNHDNQSSDPRFKWGRQDQTAFTIAFHKAGFTHMYDQNVFTSYYERGRRYPESVMFLIKGL